MKLFHLVSGADGGGARTHVHTLLPALRVTDEVCLLCLGDGPMVLPGSDCLILEGGFWHQRRELEALLRAERPDVLHCHGARAAVCAALCRRGTDTRFLSTIHSDHRLDYLGRPAAAAVIPTLYRWALGRMDALVCVSETMTERCRRGFQTVFSIFNGMDFSSLIPERQMHGDTVDVGIAARLDPVKDLSTLLRGFALAAAREPRLRLRIAGTGREEKKLRALADTLGIADKTEFCGWVEDTERFYASLDIAVLTSLSETFPYALLMAARHALPVVATDVGGVGELVRWGEDGVRIRPGDAVALGSALLMLCADENLRRAMGERFRAQAQTRFTTQQMAQRQREIYAQLFEK